MTRLMEKAIDALSRLPDDEQDAMARHILELTDIAPVELTADERAAVKTGLADARAGRFADQASVDKIIKRLRDA